MKLSLTQMHRCHIRRSRTGAAPRGTTVGGYDLCGAVSESCPSPIKERKERAGLCRLAHAPLHEGMLLLSLSLSLFIYLSLPLHFHCIISNLIIPLFKWSSIHSVERSPVSLTCAMVS